MLVRQLRNDFAKNYTRSTAGIYANEGTGSPLYVFFVLEDTVRGNGDPATVANWKIKGQTAIPYGSYDLAWALSPSRQVWTLRLLNVPGYLGILVHSGNTEKDTEGCLLPGTSLGANSVQNSKAAVEKIESYLVPELTAGRNVKWIITKND